MRIQVSIIIATFNAGKILSRALDSVKTQSLQNWECIIIDGASKDNTIDIIKEYQMEDNRFRFISEPDKGIYDAFNKGWKLAKGEWIYYLGADDMLEKNGLSNLLKEPVNADVIYGDVMSVHSNNKKIYRKSPKTNELKKKMMSHQSLIMRHKMLEELKGFDTQYKICADLDLILRGLGQNKQFIYKNSLVAYFAVGGISSSSTANLKEAYSIRIKHAYENKFYLTIRFIQFYIGKLIQLVKEK